MCFLFVTCCFCFIELHVNHLLFCIYSTEMTITDLPKDAIRRSCLQCYNVRSLQSMLQDVPCEFSWI